MGFFTEQGVFANGNVPYPLSVERVRTALSELDLVCDEMPDGLVSGFATGAFLFSTDGERHQFLDVRGQWRVQLPAERWVEALEVCGQWSAKAIWPRVYPARGESGRILVNAEHNVDYSAGITDDQLRQHIVCALDTSMGFFDHLNETFPQEWALAQGADDTERPDGAGQAGAGQTGAERADTEPASTEQASA